MNSGKGFSRRRFLSAVASTAATSCLPLTGGAILAGASTPAGAQQGHIGASREAVTIPPLLIINQGYRLLIDAAKGTLVSFRSTYGSDRELLIADHVDLPLFKIEFMDEHAGFRTVTSSEAKETTIRREGNEQEPTITIEYKEIGELPVDARVTIGCQANDTLTYWSLELKNGTTMWIGHVQFPVLEVPFDDPMENNSSHILSSWTDGALVGPVSPAISAPQSRNTPEMWRRGNYPGQWTTMQLMAHYNSVGGLYLACDDAMGLPKFIDWIKEDDGITLGLGHYPGTRGPGETKLPYNVVLGTFHGDWYRAAEIYRDWALKQPFCPEKLAERKDCPKWIGDSPIGITFPLRGQSDWNGPAVVNPDYAPATNALPYLEKLAAALDCSLMPILFNWEHAGPWVQPDAFPPIGGEAGMREFMAKAKEKGWHPVVYGDGLCWITAQKNTNYNGISYFHDHGGDAVVVRKWDGSLCEWKGDWRTIYIVCVGTEKGRQMVLEMTRKMTEFGSAVVQQFDQGGGPMACYATDHGHPPVPGPWMAEAFQRLLKDDLESAHSVNPGVAMSCEGAPSEVYLSRFQLWDARMGTCPLYSFIYHEYGNGYSGFYTNRVDDEALRLSVARAVVNGYMLNFTLRDKGLIEYDWDDTWTRAIPDQSAILDWAKRNNHFRAGIARDYLIYGRMLRPWRVSNLTERDFGLGKETLVQSATWQAQDGRIGIVLANSADLGESPRVELQGQGARQLTLWIDGETKERSVQLPLVMDLEMAPRSLCLIELK